VRNSRGCCGLVGISKPSREGEYHSRGPPGMAKNRGGGRLFGLYRARSGFYDAKNRARRGAVMLKRLAGRICCRGGPYYAAQAAVAFPLFEEMCWRIRKTCAPSRWLIPNKEARMGDVDAEGHSRRGLIGPCALFREMVHSVERVRTRSPATGLGNVRRVIRWASAGLSPS